jgi:HAD superfamily hydrolase (TIGR01490 family)
MDRTLIRRETATLWMRYQRDTGQASWLDSLRVSYWVLQYTFGVIRVEEIVERAVLELRGTREDVFASRSEDWFAEYVERYMADRGREAVLRHREEGDVVAIVTGATPYAARPLATRLGIEHVLASELEVDAEGRFTGLTLKPLCYGEGKVTRARALGERLGFALEEATFYSDSLTDLPLLEAVREPVVVNPDPRLRRVARRRGWRVESW